MTIVMPDNPLESAYIIQDYNTWSLTCTWNRGGSMYTFRSPVVIRRGGTGSAVSEQNSISLLSRLLKKLSGDNK